MDMDGWNGIDGYMDEWRNGLLDGWMDGWWMEKYKNGLRMDEPRFAQLLPNGEIQEFSCLAIFKEDMIS